MTTVLIVYRAQNYDVRLHAIADVCFWCCWGGANCIDVYFIVAGADTTGCFFGEPNTNMRVSTYNTCRSATSVSTQHNTYTYTRNTQGIITQTWEWAPTTHVKAQMQSALSTTHRIPETRKEPSTNMRVSTYTHVKTKNKQNKTKQNKQIKQTNTNRPKTDKTDKTKQQQTN